MSLQHVIPEEVIEELLTIIMERINQWSWKGSKRIDAVGVRTVDPITGFEIIIRQSRPVSRDHQPKRWNRPVDEVFDPTKHFYSFFLKIEDKTGRLGWRRVFEYHIDSENQGVERIHSIFRKIVDVADFSRTTVQLKKGPRPLSVVKKVIKELRLGQ